jgi:hypothetical protein
MNINGIRAAIYLRVSRDDQTTENQRLVLERVAGHRGWTILDIPRLPEKPKIPPCESARLGFYRRHG